MSQPEIKVIPMGATAVKTGNDWFRIIYQGARISKQHEKDKKK